MSTVLYRKYRAKTFGEIRGQQVVVDVITNSIKQGNPAHAYLFSGPRGTGKTSIARLVAKAVNDSKFAKKGDIDPNNDISRSIEQGSFLDLIEIDAASNRGIEEIRQIRESVNYLPTQGSYKVYIIDEVHMLTREAFNALLKTLEEPPSHVLFILATTEPHKIPDTILSRVQRFDFKLASAGEIIDKLTHILKQEGFKADSDVLDLVTEHAAGSYRDAESILGKVLSEVGSQKKLTRDLVVKVLGLAPEQQVERFIDTLQEGKQSESLQVLEDLYQQGIDIFQFTKQLIARTRKQLIDSVKSDQDYVRHLGLLRSLLKIQNEYRFVDDAKVLLELLVFEFGTVTNSPQEKMTSPSNNKTSAKMVKKLEQKPVEQKDDSIHKDVQKKGSKSSNTSKTNEKWKRLLKLVREQDFKTWAFLRSVDPEFEDGKLTLVSKYQNSLQSLQLEQVVPIMNKAVEGAFGSGVTLEYKLVGDSVSDEVLSNESIVETIF